MQKIHRPLQRPNINSPPSRDPRIKNSTIKIPNDICGSLAFAAKSPGKYGRITLNPSSGGSGIRLISAAKNWITPIAPQKICPGVQSAADAAGFTHPNHGHSGATQTPNKIKFTIGPAAATSDRHPLFRSSCVFTYVAAPTIGIPPIATNSSGNTIVIIGFAYFNGFSVSNPRCLIV